MTRKSKPEPIEVIVKVVHVYEKPEPDTQYKQSHPDEYEWSNFWNDWVRVPEGSRRGRDDR